MRPVSDCQLLVGPCAGDKDYDLLEAADTQRWLVCAYFALTTMGTIGYGDITPGDRWRALWLLLLCVGLFSYVMFGGCAEDEGVLEVRPISTLHTHSHTQTQHMFCRFTPAPVTFSETGLVLVFEVVGVVFFGYLLNQVAAVLAAVGPSGRRQEAIKNKLQARQHSSR